MKFNVAICDDETEGLYYIKKLLTTYYFDTGVEFNIKEYTSPDCLISEYDMPGKFDLMFLDVEMPGSNMVERGIEIANQIRSLPDNDVKIIFVSNYPEYMNLGYDVQASHYLSKDTSFARFKQVLDKIIFRIEADKSIITVKNGRDQKYLLRINEIICIKAFHRVREHVVFCMKDGSQYEDKKSILSISEELKTHHFAFANKYALVNIQFVKCYDNNCLILDNHEIIPLSRYYKKDFIANFSNGILNLSE